MDLALYDPQGGYYRAAEARPGRTGDFLTAPEAHPDLRSRRRPRRSTRPGVGSANPGGSSCASTAPATARSRWPILDGLRRDAVRTPRRHRLRPGRGRTSAHRRDRVAPDGGRARRTSSITTTATMRRSSGRSSPTRSSTRCRSTACRRRGAVLRELAVGLDGDRFVEVEIEPTTPALADAVRVGRDRARRWPDRRDLPRARRLGRGRRGGPGRRAPAAHRLRRDRDRALRSGPPARRHPSSLRAPPRPRRPVPARRPAGPHRARRRDGGRAGGGRRRPDAPGHHDPGRVPRRGRHRRAPARDPVGSGDLARGVPRRSAPS